MAASSNVPAVNAKNAALVNDVAVDVKRLEVEEGEIAKFLANLPPGHPAAGAVSVRRAQIATAKKSHE